MEAQADNVKITLPDGSTKSVPKGTTVRQIAEMIGPRLAKDAIAGKIDGRIVDLVTAEQPDAPSYFTYDAVLNTKERPTLANALERVMNLDADALKRFRLADTGEFQKLGRIDRTGADDHFPVGPGFVLLSVHIVAHPDAALAFEQQTFSQRIGLDGQVWPPSRRIQIADGGAHPTTTADRRLGHANPILSRAVIVLGIRDADLAGRLDERVVDRSALVAFCNLQRPAAAARQ